MSSTLPGSSYAELARITQHAIKLSILDGNKGVSDDHLRAALRNAERRRITTSRGGTGAASR